MTAFDSYSYLVRYDFNKLLSWGGIREVKPKKRQKGTPLFHLAAQAHKPAVSYGRFVITAIIIRPNLCLESVTDHIHALAAYLWCSGQNFSPHNPEAFSLLHYCAYQGCAEEQLHLAHMYQTGSFVKKNTLEATRLYQSHALMHHAEAKYRLSLIFLEERGHQNIPEGLRLLRNAIDLRHGGAVNRLGLAYYRGEGVGKDLKQAFLHFKEAADLGVAEAQFNLAAMYQEGIYITQDMQEAVRNYKRASDQGDVGAQYQLAMIHLEEEGSHEDIGEGIRYLTLASHGGHVEAKKLLALHYEIGEEVDLDLRSALNLYTEAAIAGDVVAQCKVGSMWRNGELGVRNLDEASSFYRRAALQGNPYGQYHLALIYQDGPDKNLYQAAYYFSRAAEQGYAPAKHCLGYDDNDGVRVKKDTRQALRLYELISLNDEPNAQCYLASLYLNEHTFPGSRSMAIALLKLAVVHNHILSKNMLHALELEELKRDES